jgi:hypothetical protein
MSISNSIEEEKPYMEEKDFVEKKIRKALNQGSFPMERGSAEE